MKEKVTSLKWSKALVEAGVKVETEFFHVIDQWKEYHLLRRDELDMFIHTTRIPAPLCVELLSLLPKPMCLEVHDGHFHAYLDEEMHYKTADNPADALAQMAIFLKNKEQDND